jgi:hypothetical protein
MERKNNKSNTNNDCSKIFSHSFAVRKLVPLLSNCRRSQSFKLMPVVVMCASWVYSEGEETQVEKLLTNLRLSHFRVLFSGSPIVFKIEYTFKTILICNNIGISVLYISLFSI